MKKWESHFRYNDGNLFPQQPLIIFFKRNFSKKKKKLKILDLGCGSGSSMMLLDEKNIRADLVDASSTAIDKAKKKYSKLPNVSFYNMSFEDFLKKKENHYDLIIDSTSLQHIENLKNLSQVYRMIYKNLKKNGIFFTIHINSSNGLHDESFKTIKLSKNKIKNFIISNRFSKINYNIYYYTEENSKKYIKFNVISSVKTK